MSTTIVYIRPDGGGWGPITAMAGLTARLLQADLHVVARRAGRLRRAATMLPRLRGSQALLVIAPVPEALDLITLAPGLRHRYGTVIGWVIDCWWTSRIPVSVRRGRLYDRLLVTEKEDVGPWRRATGLPVDWVPLGADVLGAVHRRGGAGSYERADLDRAAERAGAAAVELARYLRHELAPRAGGREGVGPDGHELWMRRMLGTRVDPADTFAWAAEQLRGVVAAQDDLAAQVLGERAAGGRPGGGAAALEAHLRYDRGRALTPEQYLEWAQGVADEAWQVLVGPTPPATRARASWATRVRAPWRRAAGPTSS